LTDAYRFASHFEDCMEMNAPAAMVANYLDVHQEWFRRCARPLSAELISENGYALSLGKFGALGYDIEPKIGLDLLPQDHGMYSMVTIPVPNYQPQGYDVDFRASLKLREISPEEGGVDEHHSRTVVRMTKVEWHLDLEVMIYFPQFIQRLPKTLIQSTGDQLLRHVVGQISRRLTRRVQQDFHSDRNLPMPRYNRRNREIF